MLTIWCHPIIAFVTPLFTKNYLLEQINLYGPFTINLCHGDNLIENSGFWSYIGGVLEHLNIYRLDTFSYYELEKDVRRGLGYVGIKMIAYLKSGMGFSEGLTFFVNDNECLEMVLLLREGRWKDEKYMIQELRMHT